MDRAHPVASLPASSGRRALGASLKAVPWAGVVAANALLYLVFLTVPYLRTAAATLAHANTLGARQAIPTLVVVAALAVLGGVVGAVGRPRWTRLYVRGVLVGAGLFLLGILVAGRVAPAALVVIWLLAVGWALGDRVLRLIFRGAAPGGAERATFAIALALGLYSHATLGLALLGLLYQWLAAALLVAATLALWRDPRDGARVAYRTIARAERLVAESAEPWFALPLFALLVGWAAIVLVEAVAPEINYDSLTYHLALPKIYIEHHGFVLTPYHRHSWYYLGADMNYLLAMLLADQTAAKLTSFAFWPLLAGAVFTLGRRMFSVPAGLFAAALLATVPLVAQQASMTYVDLAMSYYCFLAAASVYLWLIERRPAWLVVGGLLAGFAISTKLNAGALMVLLGVVVTVVSLADRRRPIPRRIVPILAYAGAAILTTFPWPLLRYVQTGSPFFPLLNNFFPSPMWTPSYDLPGSALGTEINSDLSYLLDVPMLPWIMTFSSYRYVEFAPGSAIGLALMIAPLAILWRSRFFAVAFLALLALAFSAAWFYTLPNLRYYFAGLPLVYLLAGYALARLAEARIPFIPPRVPGVIVRSLVLVWIASSLPLFLALFSSTPERIPYRVAFGLESRDDFLSRVIRTYDAYQLIDRTTPDGPIHILAIGDEYRLYTRGIVETNASPTMGNVIRERDHEQLRRLVREHGLTHLLINRRTARQRGNPPPIAERPFLDANAKLEYDQKDVQVYRFRTDGG